jgi:DMSO/TMAO reductase YedYZ molybdopterin-dependent catalytic subunit
MARQNPPDRSVQELYRDDPERADALVWGRRGALQGAALAAMGAALGATIPFARNMPGGLVPAALAQGGAQPQLLQMEGKAPLIMQGERPLNAETPEHLLDDAVTPADKFFIRNNGNVPDPVADPRAWKIRIDGEVNTPLELTIAELEQRFEVVTRKLQMECGGNGRSGFSPQAAGNQWGNGAISNAEWTGVRLRDVLRAAGVKDGAKFTGQHGADTHLSAQGPAISRGMRIEKALDEDTLICFRMNGAAIPHTHGTRMPAGTRSLDIRGHAWAGDLSVRDVHVSTDFGQSWQAMQVAAPPNRHSWQRWQGRIALPSDGYFEIWYRATDSNGRMQPHVAANWNPQGYGANPISRVAILIG